MNEIVKASYADARYEAACIAKSGILELTGTIDYLNKETGGDLPSLLEYMKAHDSRLGEKVIQAKREQYGAIAYIEHHITLHANLARVFEQQAAAIEQMHGIDPYIIRTIGTTRGEIQEKQDAVRLFVEQYQTEVLAERASDGYGTDQDIIRGVVTELGKATLHGQWTPEFIDVNDWTTGKPTRVEMPSSREMGKVAAMAPKFRRLGLGTT